MYDLLHAMPKGMPYLKKEYEKNEIIIDPCRSSGFLYLLVSGRAVVYSLGIDGDELTVYEYHGIDCFGEIELLCGRRYPLTVRAATDCTVYLIAQRDFLQWIREDSKFSLFLLKRMSEKLLQNSDRMTRLSLLTMRERYLLSIHEHETAGDLATLTKARVAEEICAPVRSLNRLIAGNRHLIAYDKAGFIILDDQKLREICERLQDMLLH